MVMEFSVGRASQKSAARSFHVLEPKGTKWHLTSYVAIAGNYLLMMFYTTAVSYTHLKREQLYLQILELHGYELITTVSELEEKVSDSFFIKQWVIKDEWGKSTTLHHVNYDRARIIFLYDQKAKKLSPPILMSEFWEMISNIDYHFLCCLERPFRKYKDMIEYSIPLGKKPKI